MLSYGIKLHSHYCFYNTSNTCSLKKKTGKNNTKTMLKGTKNSATKATLRTYPSRHFLTAYMCILKKRNHIILWPAFLYLKYSKHFSMSVWMQQWPERSRSIILCMYVFRLKLLVHRVKIPNHGGGYKHKGKCPFSPPLPSLPPNAFSLLSDRAVC